MARKLRATHAGIHHVFARSQVEDPLFRDDHDHLRFETELRTICAHEVALTCIAACTIGTHYHLLLEVEDGVLPTVMKQLNSAYARAFNARYQRRGHAFASRYGSKPVLFDRAAADHVPLRCAESGRSRAMRSPCRLALEQLQHAGRPKRSLRLRGSFTGAGGLRRIARDPSRICRGVS